MRWTVPRVVAAALFGLCVIEGCSSVVLVTRKLIAAPPLISERAHTQYDPELGWSNIPNTEIDDLYGEGKSLEINAQGFRNDHSFTREIPAGRVRLICNGDSFTLGYGVDDRETWCQQLIAEDPRFETVNMGQGGYGLDQAYLWYARDGVKLDHDVQVLAFISSDFDRMMYSKFAGYAKPRLALRDGEIVSTNTPLSKATLRFPWLAQNAQYFLGLRSLQLLGRPGEPGGDQAEARALALRIFERLQIQHQSRNSELLVVFLPRLDDFDGHFANDWQVFLKHELAQRHIPYLDLIDALKKLDPAVVPRLFAGHYSAAGNRWAAVEIARAVHALPRVSQRLKNIPAPAEPIKPWRLRLYANDRLEGEPKVLHQRTPSLDWKRDAPSWPIAYDRYSIRWDTCLALDRPTELPLALASDDGSRMFIDGKLVLDNWGDHALKRAHTTVHLEAGRHTLLIEYFQIGDLDAFELEADLGARLLSDGSCR